MNQRLAMYLALFAVVLISLLLLQCTRTETERHQLSVHVVQLLDGSPVTGATVEIASSRENTVERSDGRAIARRSLDDEGWALFHLPASDYVVRMASGYTGRVNVSLQEDKEVTLEVIRVAR